MKKKTNQSVTVHIPVTMLASIWKGDFQKLPANKTYELIIDYPFGGECEHRFPIKTGTHGLGLVTLLGKIGKAYEKIYEDPDANGVFGHDIDDLNLSGVRVNHKTKKIRLDVDS